MQVQRPMWDLFLASKLLKQWTYGFLGSSILM